MRIPRIYCPEILTAGLQITLDVAASHRLLQVLRLKKGASLHLFNENSEHLAELIQIQNRLATVTLKHSMPCCLESSLAIHLIQGIARAEKMDFILQKSVELGVTEITPVFTERCGVDLTGERLNKRMQHWQNVIIQACEQSGRHIIPRLHTAQPLPKGLQQAVADLSLVLDPQATITLANLAQQTYSVAILIGPEGGLSSHEIALAQQNKFVGLRLGPRILRTETAPLAIIAALQCRWGDFK